MIEIDFVELIQNCLAVASSHRDRLFRTQLSIATPLSAGLVRHTKTPIYGPRAPSSPRPSLVINTREYSPRRLDISSAKGFKTELALLQEFQNLQHFLQGSPGVPSTQIPKLMRALSRFPIISITALAKEAKVSKVTAKRWLVGLEKVGKLQVREFNGMNQYAYKSILEILDRFVRLSGVP